MKTHDSSNKAIAANGLRPVAYVYAAVNIAVAVLLFSTVSPTLPTAPTGEVASLR